jgi:copper transport protein
VPALSRPVRSGPLVNLRHGAAMMAGALLAVVWLAAGPYPASAHALLASSVPADGASVDTAPAEATLTFTETPDLALAVVHVLDSSGKQVEAGKARAVPGEPYQLRVPLSALGKGTYTLTWRTTSSVDGHTTAGSIAFGVGVPAAVAGEEGAAAAVRTPTPTPIGIAGRWLFYVGVVLLLGAATVGAFVVSDPAAISRAMLGSAWVVAAGGLVLTIADQRANSETSLGNLLSSSTGHKLTTQVVAVGIAGATVAWACLRRSRSARAMVGVGAAAAMLARAVAGHADASSARWFTVGVQWIHLVSVGAWVGGLVWLLVAMRRGDAGQGPGLARRFSSIATVTLALVAVSGTVRALDEVGAWTRLLHTDFGVALSVKVGIFSVLVALGAVSRFRHVPRATPGPAGDGLRRLVRAEVVVGAAVLGATAVLAGFPPSVLVAAASKPRPTPVPAVTVTGNDYATSVRVRLVVTPGLPGPNVFDAMVADYDSGKPSPAEGVSLRFQLSDQPDVSGATLELARSPDDHWRGTGRGLSIDGKWAVTALVRTPTDAVEVPMELVTRRPPTAATDAPGTTGCNGGQQDPAYTLVVDTDPNPPQAEGAVVHMTLRHDGKAVTGARVCVITDMPDMQHTPISTTAKELPGGRYDAELKFGMGGAWAGSVIVAEPGKPAVSLSVKFDVK